MGDGVAECFVVFPFLMALHPLNRDRASVVGLLARDPFWE